MSFCEISDKKYLFALSYEDNKTKTYYWEIIYQISGTFSKEVLIRAYAEFLSQTVEKNKHNVGIVLHSGSLCFDALILTYAAITNLLFNQTFKISKRHRIFPKFYYNFCCFYFILFWK